MLTSARNMMKAVISSVLLGPVQAEIGLMLSDEVIFDAIVTRKSAERLQLNPGREVTLLIKSSSVILAVPMPGLILSTRNQALGTIVDMIEGHVNTEVAVDIGLGITMFAVVTSQSAEAMKLAKGQQILCCVKASQIILAVEE